MCPGYPKVHILVRTPSLLWPYSDVYPGTRVPPEDIRVLYVFWSYSEMYPAGYLQRIYPTCIGHTRTCTRSIYTTDFGHYSDMYLATRRIHNALLVFVMQYSEMYPGAPRVFTSKQYPAEAPNKRTYLRLPNTRIVAY